MQICIFIFCVFGGKTTLKDLELTRIRNADMAAVSVAIKRGTARRGHKSNTVFAAGLQVMDYLFEL